MRAIRLVGIAAALVLLLAPFALTAGDKDIETEKRLGREGAEAAAKELKFLKDPEQAKRVDAIATKIALAAETVKVPATYGSSTLADFDYAFKLVDDDEVNAFSLPAGHIYINKGLLRSVQSDDELAGVIAHEVAHVAHHHMIKLIQKQSKLDGTVFLVLAAAIIGKVQPQDMQNIFYGAKLLEVAKLNAYSQKAEDDADSAAFHYMVSTGYNPVGLLTFMERMAHKEATDPRMDNLGVMQTHPPSKDRARNILSLLRKSNVPINRRAVSQGVLSAVREVPDGDKTWAEVTLGGRLLVRTAEVEGSSSLQRAQAVASLINDQLAGDPLPYEVRLGSDGSSVWIRQKAVLEVLPEDAGMAGTTPEALARRAKEAIQSALASERISRVY